MSENAKYVTESHNIVMRVDFVESVVFPAYNGTGLSDTLHIGTLTFYHYHGKMILLLVLLIN